MAKKYYWLRLKDNFFNQKEIKKLRKIAGGDTYTIIYLKMQLQSIKKDGILTFDGTEKDLAEQLSFELDEEIDNIAIVLSYLKANNLIEELEPDNYLLNKVPECIGKESESAERVRNHRKRKALEGKEQKILEEEKGKETLQCNDEVTEGNTGVTKSNTEIEKEKEKEIDIKKEKKEKKLSEFDILINSHTSNEELKKTLYEFIKMRKTIKKPMTSNALKLLLNKLNEISSNDDSYKIESLNNSIFNSWAGIFELKDRPVNTTKSNKESKPNAYSEEFIKRMEMDF